MQLLPHLMLACFLEAQGMCTWLRLMGHRCRTAKLAGCRSWFPLTVAG